MSVFMHADPVVLIYALIVMPSVAILAAVLGTRSNRGAK